MKKTVFFGGDGKPETPFAQGGKSHREAVQRFVRAPQLQSSVGMCHDLPVAAFDFRRKQTGPVQCLPAAGSRKKRIEHKFFFLFRQIKDLRFLPPSLRQTSNFVGKDRIGCFQFEQKEKPVSQRRRRKNVADRFDRFLPRCHSFGNDEISQRVSKKILLLGEIIENIAVFGDEFFLSDLADNLADREIVPQVTDVFHHAENDQRDPASDEYPAPSPGEGETVSQKPGQRHDPPGTTKKDRQDQDRKITAGHFSPHRPRHQHHRDTNSPKDQSPYDFAPFPEKAQRAEKEQRRQQKRDEQIFRRYGQKLQCDVHFFSSVLNHDKK
ncbi:MAG: hypothetical protein MJ016_04965 [Victivallaceae bacterium]|nr:hypothetical protein [Victivallaceae bacterium]